MNKKGERRMSYFFIHGHNQPIRCPVCDGIRFERQILRRYEDYTITSNNIQCKKCNHLIMFNDLSNIDSREEPVEFNNF